MARNLLQIGGTWLAAQRAAKMSHAVTYARGVASVTVNATVGRTAWDVTRDDGSVLQDESRDYLITTADLVLSGSLTKPAAGDVITETLAGESVEYTVMAPGTERPWRYADAQRLTLRVHTKQTGVR